VELRIGRKVWIATAGALALGALGGLALVQAHTVKYDSAITDFTTSTIDGVGEFVAQVGAEKPNCVPNRDVRLIRDDGRKVMKSRKTNQSGVAVLRFRNGLKLDTYHLQLKKRNLGSSGHRHICSRDKTESTTYQFPDPD
jgi:hypothetical protein